MNTQKKALFSLAIIMTISVGVLQGISKKRALTNDKNLQQVSIGAGYMAGSSEGGAAGAWTAVSGLAGGAAVTVGYGALTNAWNPAGWVGGAVAGGLAL
jgi:hypothetical protein